MENIENSYKSNKITYNQTYIKQKSNRNQTEIKLKSNGNQTEINQKSNGNQTEINQKSNLIKSNQMIASSFSSEFYDLAEYSEKSVFENVVLIFKLVFFMILIP